VTGELWALLALVLVAVVAWLAGRHVRHPEDAAGGPEVAADTTSDRFYRSADRPAGPDAEDPPAAV
jgi:hypothetical protein